MLPPELLSSPPSVSLSSDLVSLAQRLAQHPPWGGEYIIVVDDQDCPIGAIALAHLWALYHYHCLAPLKPLEGGDPLRLVDCQPWLDKVVVVPDESNLTDLREILENNPQGPWVLIDRAGCYQGAIQATELLTWLMAQMPLAEGLGDRRPSSALGSRLPESLSAQAHQWLMLLNHSIKTPLTSLLGLSTLLLDPRIGSLSDRQTRYAYLMRRAIRQIIRLVNQWVDWMGLESDQFPLTVDRVDLSALTTTFLPQFHSGWLADHSSPPPWMAEFTCHLNSEVPILTGDRRCLQQSLYCVLDYLLQERSQPQALTIESWGDWLGFTLSGSYPDPDRPDSIRGSLPIPAMGPLDSLGLALARRLCQRQGGDLVGFCSSSYGYRFTLLLPLVQPPLTKGDTQPPSRSPVLVLLISRAGKVIDQVYAILQCSPYRVAVIGGGKDEMAGIQRLSPTAIIYHEESLDPPDRLIYSDLTWSELRPPALIWVGSVPGDFAPEQAEVIPIACLSQQLIPALDRICQSDPVPLAPAEDRLVLLLLRLQPDNSPARVTPPELWQQALQRYNCRLLQAEDLTQASLLCRVWQPDGILVDQTLTAEDWQRLARVPELGKLPLITLSPSLEPWPEQLAVIDLCQTMAQSPEQIATTLLHRIRSLSKKPG